MDGERPQLLTIEEFSLRSRLSLATIHRLKKAGKIPCFQPGGKGSRLLFPADAIEQACGASPNQNPGATAPADNPLPNLSGPRPSWMKPTTNLK